MLLQKFTVAGSERHTDESAAPAAPPSPLPWKHSAGTGRAYAVNVCRSPLGAELRFREGLQPLTQGYNPYQHPFSPVPQLKHLDPRGQVVHAHVEANEKHRLHAYQSKSHPFVCVLQPRPIINPTRDGLLEQDALFQANFATVFQNTPADLARLSLYTTDLAPLIKGFGFKHLADVVRPKVLSSAVEGVLRFTPKRDMQARLEARKTWKLHPLNIAGTLTACLFLYSFFGDFLAPILRQAKHVVGPFLATPLLAFATAAALAFLFSAHIPWFSRYTATDREIFKAQNRERTSQLKRALARYRREELSLHIYLYDIERLCGDRMMNREHNEHSLAEYLHERTVLNSGQIAQVIGLLGQQAREFRVRLGA